MLGQAIKKAASVAAAAAPSFVNFLCATTCLRTAGSFASLATSPHAPFTGAAGLCLRQPGGFQITELSGRGYNSRQASPAPMAINVSAVASSHMVFLGSSRCADDGKSFLPKRGAVPIIMTKMSPVRLTGTRRVKWRWLLVCWSLLTLPAILIAFLRLAAGARLPRSDPVYRALENRGLRPLGFWKWLAPAAVFLLLLSAALFLPERAAD